MSFRIFLLALLMMSNLTVAQWFWQNPLPQGNPLREIEIINGNILTSVGDFGTILNSSDGGVNWINQNSQVPFNLYSMDYIDENYGIAVGSYGTIVKTTDGGNNWSTLTIVP